MDNCKLHSLFNSATKRSDNKIQHFPKPPHIVEREARVIIYIPTTLFMQITDVFVYLWNYTNQQISGGN